MFYNKQNTYELKKETESHFNNYDLSTIVIIILTE